MDVTAGMTPILEKLAKRFESGLVFKRIDPPPIYEQPKPEGPDVPLDEYRAELLRARIQSLVVPGIYIDMSPTGSGKSFADIIATKHIGANNEEKPDRNADTR